MFIVKVHCKKSYIYLKIENMGKLNGKSKKLPVPVQLEIAFAKWSYLKVWKCNMSEIDFIIRRRSNGNHGTGQASKNKIVITVGSDRFENFSTLLHEMAHVALERRGIDDTGSSPHHGPLWQGMLIEAAEAVLRRTIAVPECTSYTDLDRFITSQFRKYKYKVF